MQIVPAPSAAMPSEDVPKCWSFNCPSPLVFWILLLIQNYPALLRGDTCVWWKGTHEGPRKVPCATSPSAPVPVQLHLGWEPEESHYLVQSAFLIKTSSPEQKPSTPQPPHSWWALPLPSDEVQEKELSLFSLLLFPKDLINI